MTAVATAGAVSHAAVEWHAIDWPKAHRHVRRLQARIVKAVQAGRWGKVKALQHLLTHSFSAKALAVKRVTENPGKRTPGVDGLLWDSLEKKAAAIGQLRQYGYRPRPLRRLWIPKHQGQGYRPLGIPCKVDLAMQALYLQALEPIAETTGDPNSYGFRKERSTADAIQQCFTVLGKRKSPKWILEGDIQAWDGLGQGVAAVYTCDGGGIDRPRVVAERGAALSRTPVAAASSRVTSWRGTDRATEQDRSVEVGLGGLNKRLKIRFET